jgi:hypothetical protein
MQAEKDSQLMNVIIGAAAVALGSFLTFLGGVINNWFASRRETKQWLRQQNADQNKRRHEERKAERERRREIYLNSLTCLTSLRSANEDETPLPPEELRKRVEETLKWLNQLSLPYRVNESEQVSKFHTQLELFIDNPLSEASDMKAVVTELAMTDRTLFPSGPKEEPKMLTATGDLPNEETITFQMDVNDDFRKQQIKNAILVPQTHIFTLQLSDLTEQQRELLAEIYFPNHKRIPATIQLPMPSAKLNTNYPYLMGSNWKARCNPHTTKPNELLNLWEQDYKEAFKKRAATADSQAETQK